MVRGAASKIVGVEQVDRALFSGGGHKCPVLKGEHFRATRTEIQVMGIQKFPIAGRKGVHDPGCMWSELQHRFAPDACARIEWSVRRLCDHCAARTFCNATPAPWSGRPGAARVEMRHARMGEVADIHCGNVSPDDR